MALLPHLPACLTAWNVSPEATVVRMVLALEGRVQPPDYNDDERNENDDNKGDGVCPSEFVHQYNSERIFKSSVYSLTHFLWNVRPSDDWWCVQ